MSDESEHWDPYCPKEGISHEKFFGAYDFCSLCNKKNPKLAAIETTGKQTPTPQANAPTVHQKDSSTSRPVINFNNSIAPGAAAGTPALGVPSNKSRSHDSFASITTRHAQQQRALGFKNNQPPVTNAASLAVTHRPATPVAADHKRKKQGKAKPVLAMIGVLVEVYTCTDGDFTKDCSWDDIFTVTDYPLGGIDPEAGSACFADWLLTRSPYEDMIRPDNIPNLAGIWLSRGTQSDGAPSPMSPKVTAELDVEKLVSYFPMIKNQSQRRVLVVLELNPPQKPAKLKLATKKTKKSKATKSTEVNESSTGARSESAAGNESGNKPIKQETVEPFQHNAKDASSPPAFINLDAFRSPTPEPGSESEGSEDSESSESSEDIDNVEMPEPEDLIADTGSNKRTRDESVDTTGAVIDEEPQNTAAAMRRSHRLRTKRQRTD